MEEKKKRLLIMVLFGVAAIAAVLLLTDSYAPQSVVIPSSNAPASVLPPAAAGQSSTPVLPKGAETVGRTIRDIFSPPAEFASRTPSSAVTNGASRGDAGPAFATGPTPVLTGVIEGSGTRVAILRQGTVSRSHRVGESTGAYRITAIGARSVTLSGPGGTLVLTMGQ